MFCPSCGDEYVEGFSRCAHCDVDLVIDPPAPAEAEHPALGDFATAFQTSDPVLLMTAKAMLEQAGIPYTIRSEGTQDLFGLGRLGTGYSLVVGPTELQVPAERKQEAEELLRQAKLDQIEEGSDEEEEEWGDG
jgi:hypothetical protein